MSHPTAGAADATRATSASSAIGDAAQRHPIAILGGTGGLGGGLAIRFARAGRAVIIGSRDAERAAQAAAALGPNARGGSNEEAAQAAPVVVLAVPAAHQLPTLQALKPLLEGRLLIDVTVPLVPPKVGTVQLPPEGSAGVRAQRLLGPATRVVSAFQNIAADLLRDPEATIDCDVLVTGNDKAARQEVVALAAEIGLRAWHAGPIENAAAAEALTSVLIQINRQGVLSHAGIRVVGTPAG